MAVGLLGNCGDPVTRIQLTDVLKQGQHAAKLPSCIENLREEKKKTIFFS